VDYDKNMMIHYVLPSGPQEGTVPQTLQHYWNELREFGDLLAATDRTEPWDDKNYDRLTELSVNMAIRAAALRDNRVLLVGYYVPPNTEVNDEGPPEYRHVLHSSSPVDSGSGSVN
jgi:hypothetical protein